FVGPGGDRALDDATRASILAEAERLSRASLRVLAVARRDITEDLPPESLIDRVSVAGPSGEVRVLDVVEERLAFIGLVGMIDPPREGVREAVAACADAGVQTVMITGDHRLTAVAIARELGIFTEGALALTGQELEQMSDDALADVVLRTRVFARVTPEQKLRVVHAFKARGHIVAMTGDGVNDAPALREAHIGIAMGKTGTDVARGAADMVIADDNFATIVDAVREGRAIYRNIQKFIFFLLSANAGLLFTVFTASFLDDLLPLSPLMILWINLVTNGLPALALGIDPPDESQMREPPRRTGEGLLGRREYIGIAFVGVVMGTFALACYAYPWSTTGSAGAPSFADGVEPSRAVAFSLLAVSPLFHAFKARGHIVAMTGDGVND
ncbi:HAD family hydrolase, partial [bacterium]